MFGCQRLDAYLKASRKVRVESSDYRIHPRFSYTELSFDIALIILPYEVAFSKSIQPVKLPSGYLLDEKFSGEVATVAGWGKICDACDNAKILRFTQNRILQNRECSKLLQARKFPSSSQLCLSTVDKKSACRGDSGSPLTIVRQNATLQIGLDSHGYASCEDGLPTIFTRLNKHFVEWIIEEITTK